MNGSQCSCTPEWTGITCETGTYCVSIVVLKDIACTSYLVNSYYLRSEYGGFLCT